MLLVSLLNAQTDASIINKIMYFIPDSTHKYVKYDSVQKLLEINGTVIPVTESVILKSESDTNGKCYVAFYFQGGIGVSKVDDSTYKRAYHRLDVKGKNDAKEVIALYKKLL